MQIVSGAALVGLKLGIAVIVLAVVAIGMIRQRRLVARGSGDSSVRPLLLTVGVAAIVNVGVAVLWE